MQADCEIGSKGLGSGDLKNSIESAKVSDGATMFIVPVALPSTPGIEGPAQFMHSN
jgi:hypothetical protein